METITSTFDTTIEELIENAFWVGEKLHDLSEQTIFNINVKLDALYPVAKRYDRTFKSSKVVINEDLVLKLENNASNLWNQASVLFKSSKSNEVEKVLLRIKMFTTVLLSIQNWIDPTDEKRLRIWKCHISCFKIATEIEVQPSIVHEIQDQATEILEILETALKMAEPGWKPDFIQLKMEFCCHNLCWSLKNEEIELIDFYCHNLNLEQSNEFLHPNRFLELCRIVYNGCLNFSLGESNKRLNQNVINKSIIQILKKFVDYINQNNNNLSLQAGCAHIRYSLLSLLISFYLNSDDDLLDVEYCNSLINTLEVSYPKKPEPYLFLIKMIERKRNDIKLAESIEEVIMRMILSVNIAENIGLILKSINNLNSVSTNLSLICLDYLLFNKINPQSNVQILEQTIISKFFLVTQSKFLTEVEAIETLQNFCEQLQKLITKQLSSSTVSAIITLLWNEGKKLEKHGQLEMSCRYFKCALSPVLVEAYTDQGKIERALISCYIDMEKLDLARQLLVKASSEFQQHPLSQLLLLKIFWKEGSMEDSYTCLEKIISSGHTGSIDIFILGLSNCKENPKLTEKSLMLFFRKLDESSMATNLQNSNCMPILALLRFNIQLLLKLAESSNSKTRGDYFHTILLLLTKCQSYLRAMNEMKKSQDYSQENNSCLTFTVDDIEWFASTSFNLTIKSLHDGFDADLNSLARVTKEFVKLISIEEFDLPQKNHFLYWKFKASVLSFDVFVLQFNEAMEGQLENEISDSLVLLQEIVTHRQQVSLEDRHKFNDCLVDAVTCHFDLLLFSKDKTKILKFIEASNNYENDAIDNIMVFKLLNYKFLPRMTIIEILEVILTVRSKIANYNILSLIQWTKHLLQFTLAAEKILEIRFVEIVQNRVSQINLNSIPLAKPEIETLGTLCWNQGVNCIINEEKSLGYIFCTKSIELATLVDEELADHIRSLWVALAKSAGLDQVALEK